MQTIGLILALVVVGFLFWLKLGQKPAAPAASMPQQQIQKAEAAVDAANAKIREAEAQRKAASTDDNSPD